MYVIFLHNHWTLIWLFDLTTNQRSEFYQTYPLTKSYFTYFYSANDNKISNHTKQTIMFKQNVITIATIVKFHSIYVQKLIFVWPKYKRASRYREKMHANNPNVFLIFIPYIATELYLKYFLEFQNTSVII